MYQIPTVICSPTEANASIFNGIPINENIIRNSRPDCVCGVRWPEPIEEKVELRTTTLSMQNC